MKPEKKVIQASAGTGKTYRLSLEFVNLLLKYQDAQISFDEILVITFTNKATAEIQQRILSHLELLSKNKADLNKSSQVERVQLLHNLRTINPELEFSEADFNYLQQVFQKMLLHKNRINISTIDAFVHKIFQELFAPLHHLTNFKIDNNINDELFPEIFEHLLHKKNRDKFKKIAKVKKSRNLKKYEDLIKDIIKYRWFFSHLNNFNSDSELNKNELNNIAQSNFKQYQTAIKELFENMLEFVHQNGIKNWQKLFNKTNFRRLLKDSVRLQDKEITEILQSFTQVLSNKKLIYDNYKTILSTKEFWNKKTVKDQDLRDKLISLLKNVINKLANFLLVKLVIPEQKELMAISKLILKKYDDLKFDRGIFTYDDILFYTYRDLHNSDVSIVDPNSVLNQFYEKLSFRLRFILVDEFQDTSILQWNILYPLISELISGTGQKEYSGIIVVGDEKQSIFGWRDAERDLLLKISKFINLEQPVLKLNDSYRSGKTILDFVNYLFGNKEFLKELEQNSITKWSYNKLQPIPNISDGYVEVRLRNRSKKNGAIKKRTIYQEFIENRLIPLLNKNILDCETTAILARTNSELSMLAQIMDEHNIPYLLEATKSIFEYKAIKPIIFIIRYYVYNDVYELMKFLRSDLILMHPAELKNLLTNLKELKVNDSSFNRLVFLDKNSEIDPIKRIYHIFKKEITNPLIFVKTVLEHFNLTDRFSSVNDLKNLYRFIEIIWEFKGNPDFSYNIKDFARFCHTNVNNEDFNQARVKETKAINLTTIHKSKGLQFETVIVFFNLSRRSRSKIKGLHRFFHYNKNYNNFKELWLTYNYKKIISNSDKQYLSQENEERKIVETLDTDYVALTRAKKNLFVNAYFKKKGFDSFFNEIYNGNNSLRIQRLLFAKFYFKFKENFISESENRKIFSRGDLEPNIGNQEMPSATSEEPNFSKYFSISEPTYVERSDWNHTLKETGEKEDRILLGTIAHYYLAQIKDFNTKTAAAARRKTIAKYGALLESQYLHRLMDATNQSIEENIKFFKKQNWDLIFTEYSIFGSETESNQEYRIDRMLISHKKNEVWIIDFKTGEKFDETQIKDYKSTLSGIPYFKANKFNFKGKYIQIDLTL